eukprot:TRINITY_DN1635_c0_g1_i3.p1 TRINITY_DN1635_c0_g1~~TRINITY_DN1635_c0_g1_i3.p1  ORF type:complete len:505 (+),score=123.21 TRINITY_DN1635_c0_g1_i3:177-1691(+)
MCIRDRYQRRVRGRPEPKMANLLLLLMATIAISAVLAAPFELIPHVSPLPIPTKQQLAYQGQISALIHFGMATFFHDGDPGCDDSNWNGCDPKGGCNSSNVASFNPTNLNVSSWVESFEAIGASSAVLTAKHGCGFLGWRTNTTLPDGTPYRYHVPDHLNVVEQFVTATEAAGIGHGFYYSLTNNFYLNVASHSVRPPSTALPGQVVVSQTEFEQLALAQVTELWTQFGELTEIWLDGGCGDMCDKVAALVGTTLAKDAVAFNGGGVSASAVRWCGTESGQPTKGPGGAVWSTADCGWCPSGSGSGAPPNSTNATWYPSAVDVTLQAGDHWFFTPGDALNPLSTLVDMYHNSVGSNGHLEIDFAIDRTGGVDPRHARAYLEFGAWIKSCYGSPAVTKELEGGSSWVEIDLNTTVVMDRVLMQEDQSAGQMIAEYLVEVRVDGAQWRHFSSGVTIGAKRIDIAAPVPATGVRVSVLTGFGLPTGLSVSVFAAGPCDVKQFEYPTE